MIQVETLLMGFDSDSAVSIYDGLTGFELCDNCDETHGTCGSVGEVIQPAAVQDLEAEGGEHVEADAQEDA